MNIVQNFITKNIIYQRNVSRQDSRYVKFQDRGPVGLILHSVGCAQPNADVFFKNYNIPNYEVSVHAFVDNSKVLQTMPWNYRATHCGGNANETHLGIEMTEPGFIEYQKNSANWSVKKGYTLDDVKKFVMTNYNTCVELFAELCKHYKLDPLKDGVIISHNEGHKRGVASGHVDVEHIWDKIGLTMNQFRKDVANKMAGDTKPGSGNNPSSWAKEACDWAIANKLFLGDGKGNYDWQENMSREAFASVMYKYHQLLDEKLKISI